jgi:hypothetical protein
MNLFFYALGFAAGFGSAAFVFGVPATNELGHD